MANYIETSILVIDSNWRFPFTVDTRVEGVLQLVNGVWQEYTAQTYSANQTAKLRVYSNYTINTAEYHYPVDAGVGRFTLSDPEFWVVFVDDIYGTGLNVATLKSYAEIVTAAAGSSDCIISNDSAELAKFTIVQGDLSTEECANGGYDEICVKTIFTQLKNYIYNENIFGQIRDKFAAFYSSIALEQRIVVSIKRLTERLLSGEITLDQFNELVKIDEQIFAEQFAKDYVANYIKLQENIEKYKYLLQ
jgi:hypothetical protein